MTAKLDLEAIRERCEAATEAPWPDNGTDSWRWPGMPRSQLAANRRFVARARSDVPALVEEVERLRVQNADYRLELENRLIRGVPMSHLWECLVCNMRGEDWRGIQHAPDCPLCDGEVVE